MIIAIKGAGDLATGVAVRLIKAGFSRIFMMELARPRAVRRTVSFCEALFAGTMAVEGVTAVRCPELGLVEGVWRRGAVAVLVDQTWQSITALGPEVVVDAIVAKKNLGTTIADGPLVIALGPGFIAGIDCHYVIETQRGHDLGRVIAQGPAAANTGVPGEIAGVGRQRLLAAPGAGTFTSCRDIGELVKVGEIVGQVGEDAVVAESAGVLRGLIRSGTVVEKGMKVGDIDPRGEVRLCRSVSDKARAVAGGVLEAIMASGVRHDRRPDGPAVNPRSRGEGLNR